MANPFNTLNTEGIDLGATYTPYVSTSAISTTNDPAIPLAPFNLGTYARASDEGEWVFCQAPANTALTVGQVLILTNAWLATPIATTGSVSATGAATGLGSLVAVSPLIAVGSGAYFWAQRAGRCLAIQTTATATSNVLLYTQNVGNGQLTSTLSTGNTVLINGIVLSTINATSGQTKSGVLNYPVVSTAS